MSRLNVLPNTETIACSATIECSAKYGNDCMFCQMTETRVKTLNHTSNRRPRRMTACPPTNQQRRPPHQNPAHRP